MIGMSMPVTHDWPVIEVDETDCDVSCGMMIALVTTLL